MFIEIYKNSCKYYSKDRKLTIEHNSYGCSYLDYGKYKEYCIDNKYHNELGAAVLYSNGNKSYYLNGKKYSHDEWLKQIEKEK